MGRGWLLCQVVFSWQRSLNRFKKYIHKCSQCEAVNVTLLYILLWTNLFCAVKAYGLSIKYTVSSRLLWSDKPLNKLPWIIRNNILPCLPFNPWGATDFLNDDQQSFIPSSRERAQRDLDISLERMLKLYEHHLWCLWPTYIQGVPHIWVKSGEVTDTADGPFPAICDSVACQVWRVVWSCGLNVVFFAEIIVMTAF